MQPTSPSKVHTSVSVLLQRTFGLIQCMDNSWVLVARNSSGDAVEFFPLDHYEIHDDMETEDARVVRNYQL